MPSYTSDIQITRVREYPSLPDTASRFTDQKVLDFMNDCLYSHIVPTIRRAKQDFLILNTEQTVASGTYEYPLPTRAAAASAYNVVVVDTNESNPNTFFELNRVMAGERNTQSDGYIIEGNNVVLIRPDQHTGQTLRIYYAARPNQVVLTTRGASITGISGAVLTVDTDLSSIITTNDSVDLIQGNPHFGWISIDEGISAIDATTITLSAANSDVAVNDYVTLKEESLIPQIPVEAHNLLAQRTVLKLLEALKDRQGYELAAVEYAKMEKEFLTSISPRVELSPRKMNSKNTYLTRSTAYRLY